MNAQEFRMVTRILSEGNLVQVRLPPPGRVVIAMRPNVAASIGRFVNLAIDGVFIEEGVTVVVDKRQDQDVYRLRFVGWEGVVRCNFFELKQIAADLRRAASSGR